LGVGVRLAGELTLGRFAEGGGPPTTGCGRFLGILEKQRDAPRDAAGVGTWQDDGQTEAHGWTQTQDLPFSIAMLTVLNEDCP
jgi:uncharacterized protein YceK